VVAIQVAVVTVLAVVADLVVVAAQVVGFLIIF
jgi:hypothetical protein